jgi:putative Mn2+ efflux pump MntP
MSVLLLGITLGLDSFRACVGLAALNKGWRRYAMLALAFGAFDALSTFVGLGLGHAVIRRSIANIAAAYVGPVLLIGYGAALITLSRHDAVETFDVGRRWMIVGVPLALSLDNLVSGVALGLARFPVPITAAILGLVSGAMALAGCWCGAIVIRLSPARSELTAGVFMVVVGVMLAVH